MASGDRSCRDEVLPLTRWQELHSRIKMEFRYETIWHLVHLHGKRRRMPCLFAFVGNINQSVDVTKTSSLFEPFPEAMKYGYSLGRMHCYLPG